MVIKSGVSLNMAPGCYNFFSADLELKFPVIMQYSCINILIIFSHKTDWILSNNKQGFLFWLKLSFALFSEGELKFFDGKVDLMKKAQIITKISCDVMQISCHKYCHSAWDCNSLHVTHLPRAQHCCHHQKLPHQQLRALGILSLDLSVLWWGQPWGPGAQTLNTMINLTQAKNLC